MQAYNQLTFLLFVLLLAILLFIIAGKVVFKKDHKRKPNNIVRKDG